MRHHSTYRGSPGHVPQVLPVIRRTWVKRYQIERFGRTEVRPLTYQPNGDRECWRRRKQMMRIEARNAA